VRELAPERRRRLIHRALPALVGIAGIAFAAGTFVGSLAPSAAERTARDFTEAWQRGDLRAMHAMLDRRSQADYPLVAFRRAYERAAATATATRVVAGDPESEREGTVVVPVSVHTRVFGPVAGRLALPVRDERVIWTPGLAFPGVPAGTRLARTSRPPVRAALLARDGQVLAEGPADGRSSPLGGLAASIAGVLEPEDEAMARRDLYARGFPPDWPVGRNGLERAFEDRLAGRPGGELMAGARLLASAEPRRATPIRTTIDPGLQEAAVAALAGRLGGIAAIDPRSGEIRALAGIAFSAPQPPGSTFKIVTATAALEAGAVKPSTRFPVQTAAIVDGVELENANREYCGGSFRDSFAHSCNSVFAPLGVKIGAQRIVNAALRYGWNAPPVVPGEAPSTIPPADEIRTPLEIGSTAIGQGRVLATPLRLASVAQVVASGGVRRQPSLEAGTPPEAVRVTSRKVARKLARLMLDVVDYGTGTAAAIPGVRVAGKTGTAELEDTRGPNAENEEPAVNDESDTDAWFTAYAPARRPRIAVAVLLVRAGAGGVTAAPAARLVLEKALAR
jgi:peptidoglycan glycosyltransferase